MVVSVSDLIFSIVIGVIGAIVVILVSAGLGYLVELAGRFFSRIADNFKK